MFFGVLWPHDSRGTTRRPDDDPSGLSEARSADADDGDEAAKDRGAEPGKMGSEEGTKPQGAQSEGFFFSKYMFFP